MSYENGNILTFPLWKVQQLHKYNETMSYAQYFPKIFPKPNSAPD